MRSATTFISIGMISGIILALFLKIIELTTGNIVYHLLFDVSYIPILNTWKPVWLIEVLFHFGTCIVSITMLYYVLTFFHLEKSMPVYIIVIGVGSSILYFLTELSNKTPSVTDIGAWIYWVIGHLLFSLTACALIKVWLPNHLEKEKSNVS